MNSIFLVYLFIHCCLSVEQNLDQIFQKHKKDNSILGIDKEIYPTNVAFYDSQLKYHADNNSLKDPKTDLEKCGNAISGSGIVYKASLAPLKLDLQLPNQDSNVCGLVLGSGKNSVTNVMRLQLLWRPNSQIPWDLLSVPNLGANSFSIVAGASGTHKVLMVDPVPASQIRLNILPVPNKEVSITVGLIHNCTFPNSVTIDDCNEKLLDNKKFANHTEGKPIPIFCSKQCNAHLPCWGYKVYSTDSPICFVAEQAMYKKGDGNYFMYPIKNVRFFRSQINPLLSSGIFCRQSNMKPGYTFNRYYHDFSNREYQMYNTQV